MAKGQKRSTREIKKPKANKKVVAESTSPFSREPAAKKPVAPRGNA